ncbi:unnamed protein product [Wuchereria bancrofti]|nr:unnamed protein product [Wuchereria bancrofti]
MCNLYPQKNSSAAKIASTKLNSTFELLLYLERKRFGNENISESADLIETICSIIDSVVEQCSQDTENESSKQESDSEGRRKRKLESPEEIMQRLDAQDLCEEMQDVKKCLKAFVDSMGNGISKIERLLNDARQFSIRSTFLSQNCLVR